MSRTTTVAVILATVIGGYQVAIHANGGAVGGAPAAAPGTAAAARTPADIARESYNSGINHRDAGDKAEALPAKDAKEAAKNHQKAADEYTKALKDFQKATDLVPNFYQAYNGLGYASRKTGDYAKALQMYDKALSLSPGFPDAIEYRGVAYLKLNRIDDAKAAYLDLFARDRKQADALMKEMNAWVSERQANPAGVDPAVVTSLGSWIQQRTQISATTSAMALTGHRSIWD